MTGRKIIFPFYHLISDSNIPHIKHLYKVRTLREFTHDLDLFLKYYKPIEITEFLESVNNNQPLKGNQLLLSFDDGLREFHDVAAPILLRKGIPAVCFLNSAFIDNADLFYRYKASLLIERLQTGIGNDEQQKLAGNWFRVNHFALTPDYHALLEVTYADRHLLDELAIKLGVDFSAFLREHQPYLTSDQISSLIQKGFSFGSHSIDHPEYRFLTEEEQLRQTAESIRAINLKFGISEKLFSFPFTDYGVKNSFYAKIFDPLRPIADLTFGGAGLKQDPIRRNFQRIAFEGTTMDARQILGTEYLYYIIKSIFGKNIIKRRDGDQDIHHR
jgi:peptidoglycan/xylan/chitin deacetylase (PgdA/CDA1 family)